MASPDVKVAVFADASQLKRELDRAQQSVAGFGEQAKKSGDILRDVLFGGAVLIGAKKVIDAASDLQQAIGGTGAVFGQASAKVDEFSKKAATLAGLSESAARTLTSQLGASLKAFGLSAEDAADKSVFLTQTGADLAATMGGTTQDAVTALAAAFRGEFDPLERFGIALKQSDINARAVALGLAESESAVSTAAKGQAALSLITERSAFAQGQFARESDTAAGQAQISGAKMQNSAADLGKSFLPIYTKVAEVVGTIADAFAALPDVAQNGIVVLGAAALIGPKLASGIGAGVSALKGLPDAFNKASLKAYDAAGAVDNFGARYAGMLQGVAAGAIVIGGAVAAWQIWEQAIHSTDDQLKKIADRQREFAKSASLDQVKDRIGAISGEIDGLTDSINNSSAPWDADYRAQLDEGRSALDQVRGELQKMVATSEDLSAATGKTSAETFAWLQQQQGAGITYADTATALAAYTGNVKDNGLSAEDAKTANQGYAQSLRDVASAAKAATDPFFATLDATQQLAKAQADAADAVAKYGKDSPEATAANEAIARAALNVEAAYLALAAQMKENGTTQDEMKAAFQRWVAQGLITQEQADTITGKFNDLRVAAEDYAGDYTATVNLQGFFEAMAQLQAIRDATAAIDPTKAQFNARTDVKNFDGSWNTDNDPTTPFAMGGMVGDGWFTVGERGPELGRKRGSSVEIFSNAKSRQMASRSGDTVTNNFYGHDPEKVLREQARQRRKQVFLAGSR